MNNSLSKGEEDYYVRLVNFNDNAIVSGTYWICDNPQDDIQELINKQMGDMYEQ